MVWNSEYTLYKILSGKIHIEYGGKKYIIIPPSFDILCNAAILYNKSFKEARLLGALSQEELIYAMIDHNLWSVSDEDLIEKLPKDIDNVKQDMYLSHAALRGVDTKRQVLKQLENQLQEKLKQKNRYAVLSAEGIAEFHKLCFLICVGCGIDYDSDVHLHSLYYAYLENLTSTTDIRNLSQDYIWQQHWTSVKLGNNIFGKVLTQEQHTLLSWSKFYDNIYESSECPPSVVIQDNDLLDGWCINQKRKRNEEDGKKAAKNFGDGGEIFVSAEDNAHAQRINELNDARAKMVRRQQQNVIQQRGYVNAQDMPDVKLELRQKAHQMLKEHAKG